MCGRSNLLEEGARQRARMKVVIKMMKNQSIEASSGDDAKQESSICEYFI